MLLGEVYLVSNKRVKLDVSPLSHQLPHVISIWFLDEVVQTLTQQPVHHGHGIQGMRGNSSALPGRASTTARQSCQLIFPPSYLSVGLWLHWMLWDCTLTWCSCAGSWHKQTGFEGQLSIPYGHSFVREHQAASSLTSFTHSCLHTQPVWHWN